MCVLLLYRTIHLILNMIDFLPLVFVGEWLGKVSYVV